MWWFSSSLFVNGALALDSRLWGDAKAQDVIVDLKSRLEDVQADAGWQCQRVKGSGEISGKMWENHGKSIMNLGKCGKIYHQFGDFFMGKSPENIRENPRNRYWTLPNKDTEVWNWWEHHQTKFSKKSTFDDTGGYMGSGPGENLRSAEWGILKLLSGNLTVS